jgi:hypothetical protein
MSPSESVGELATDDEALDPIESIDSSLIFVFNGKSTLTGFKSMCSAVPITSLRAKVSPMIAPVDFEKGDSSIGVTLMRDEGESKLCARMRTLGDGVRGGAVIVDMVVRQ